VVRLPSFMSFEEGATFGVAFVAAALSLGVCLGVDFSDIEAGPDLLSLLKSVGEAGLPEDVRAECLHGIQPQHRAKKGDWLAISGGTCFHLLYLYLVTE